MKASRRRRLLRGLLAAALALICVLVAVQRAEARAGGGDHDGGGDFGGGDSFGGGGDSFGGGYSGGWGGGYGGGGGSTCTTDCGGVTGPAAVVGGVVAMGAPIIFITFAFRAVRRSARGVGSSGGVEYGNASLPPAIDTGAVDAGLAAIHAADPGFDVTAFLDRTNSAFFALQKAWEDRNIDEARAYMSPGLYQSWNVQVQQMVQLHKKNILENLNIQGTNVARVVYDDQTDSISVKIDAVCADYEVNDQTGKLVFGSKTDKPFTEYWTFMRVAGTKTPVGGGVEAQKCPNCGAPISLNAVGSCTYCGCAVTSGKFDWVLSRIDQANEWSG